MKLREEMGEEAAGELQWWKPAAVMVAVQISFAACNLLSQVASNHGLGPSVYTAYRTIFAAAFTLPLPLLLERKEKPRITRRVLFMAFLCGLFGQTLYLNMFFGGLALTSATIVSATSNLTPAIIFIMAVSCSMEKLKLGAVSGQAKVLGTIIGIGGAMLMTFYKGKEIDIWPNHMFRHLHHPRQHHEGVHVASLRADSSSLSELLGVLCAIASCFSSSLWHIIQVKLNEEYPHHYSSTALMTTMGAIQSFVLALCVERDWSKWKLGWDISLLTVTFSGIVASGIAVVAIAWCIRVRGPLYVSVFGPLTLVFVAVAASFIFDEKFYLGSVLGAVLIVCGLYMVLWGKRKEMQNMMTRPSLPTAIVTEDSEVTTLLLE